MHLKRTLTFLKILLGKAVLDNQWHHMEQRGKREQLLLKVTMSGEGKMSDDLERSFV